MAFRSWLLLIVLVLTPVSMIGSIANPADILMLHIPTVLFLVVLIWLDRRQAWSTASSTLLFLFLLLHILGSRYLYSFVPYDAWSETLFGFRITDRFDLTRNHYDRLVHLLYGALLFHPARELVLRNSREGWVSYGFAAAILTAGSALYEIAEWTAAIVLSPEQAERYNGQQGDPFDAQKDMALALLGTVVAAGLEALLLLKRRS